jgi:uncharacterized ParB-like nuclease family protein
MSWFNHDRLLEPIGYTPPAEAEGSYSKRLPVSPSRRRHGFNRPASMKAGAIQSSRETMFVVRAHAVVEDCVLRIRIAHIRPQPGIDVLGLARDGTAVMPGRTDLVRRLDHDDREREQVGLGRRVSSGPQAREPHVLRGTGPELEDRVFAVPVHMLVEGVDDQPPVRHAELVTPEAFRLSRRVL